MERDEPLRTRTHHLRVPRSARYYSAGGADGGTLDRVWIVLHGYGQLAGEFIRYFADLATASTLVVAPEALNRFYLVGIDKPAAERPVGATWMTREDRDAEMADYVEYLDALYDEVAANAVSRGAWCNVIGFSQGAATATRWAMRGHAHINRLVLWGGLLPPDVDLTRGSAALRGARLTLVLGTRDKYVSGDQLAAEEERLRRADIPFHTIRFDGGHAVSRGVFPQLAE